MKKTIVLGSVTMTYNEQGAMISANVQPVTNVPIDATLQEQLVAIKSDTADNVKNQAQLVLGAFFSNITNAELADRADYSMVSEIVDCAKFDNEKVKQCTIKFTLQPVQAN